MSGNRYLETNDLPFCKGCGHTTAARNIETALAGMEELKPLDVVVVSDIGCIGIIDRQFATHTVHGLHGRSVALASGIAMALEGKRNKIIVLIGDGGATIGLQHLLDAAHRNLPMTVIVHNNMLYGMTGGQPSSLTPCGYRTAILPGGKPEPGVDLCALVQAAGAPLAMRLPAMGDFSAELAKAFRFEGFSYVELLELCTSYGTKFNPGKNLRELAREAGLALGEFSRLPEETPRVDTILVNPGEAPRDTQMASLLDSHPPIRIHHELRREGGIPGISGKLRAAIVLAGSAGEGVQTAAELLAKAAMACGLHVSKKGSYPVTVGIGFSLAEVIYSSAPIRYTGAVSPDCVIVTSQEGLAKVSGQISAMRAGTVYADAGLELPATAATVVSRPYRTLAGAKSALLLALLDCVRRGGSLPEDALSEAMLMTKGHPVDPVALKKLLDT